MNRLVIIGNGFDLAHGLKTNYGDFVVGYLKKVIEKAIEKKGFEDVLIKVNADLGFYARVEASEKLRKIDSIQDIKSFIENWTILVDFKGVFIRTIFKHYLELNWVDIEQEYFNALINAALLDQSFHLNKVKIVQSVKSLNSQLNYLKKELESYLSNIKVKIKDTDPNAKILRNIETFYSNRGSRVVKNIPLRQTELSDIYFLNFNYTNLYSVYIHKSFHEKVINIHGQLNDEKNPIIFGLGDEMFKDQYQIQEYNINEFYENFKSIAYLKTSCFQNLLNIIDQKEFEVYIMGHSCGISDRTLLNKIFEHKNCLSIQVFYHQREDGTNDYHDKIINIYRHFNDKSLMRELVVPFDQSRPLIK